MTGDHDDPRLARLWRDVSRETPDMLLDARILQAARLKQQRSRFYPLAAAMAACLVLALAVMQFQRPPQVQTALPDTSTFGLYEGRAGVSVAGADALDRITLDQMTGLRSSGGGYEVTGFTPAKP
jgi:hypothetical protein